MTGFTTVGRTLCHHQEHLPPPDGQVTAGRVSIRVRMKDKIKMTDITKIIRWTTSMGNSNIQVTDNTSDNIKVMDKMQLKDNICMIDSIKMTDNIYMIDNIKMTDNIYMIDIIKMTDNSKVMDNTKVTGNSRTTHNKIVTDKVL